MDMIKELGGLSVVARMQGCKSASVAEWRTRGIPPTRCPSIECATSGRVTVEQMRPDITWVRIPDPAWPHPDGRPCIDVARPTPAPNPSAVCNAA